MSKRQEVSVFSYIFLSGHPSPLPVAGACCTVLFVEPAACIAAEHPGAFQKKMNLLQSASSGLRHGKCGIFEICNPIKIFLKSARSNCDAIASAINSANIFCRRVVAFGNISHLTAEADPGLGNPKFIQVELPFFQLSDGAY
jgi:hypothetical protein